MIWENITEREDMHFQIEVTQWAIGIVVLEMTLESPLDCKKIKPVNSKGNQSWIGRTDTEAEAPILWLPDAKNWLVGTDLMLGKTEGRRRRGRQRMRQLNGITDSMDMMSVSQAPGVGDGQGSLAYCSPWGHRESDMTEKLNCTEWVNPWQNENENYKDTHCHLPTSL